MALQSSSATILQSMRRAFYHYTEDIPTTPSYQIWALDFDPTSYLPAHRRSFSPYILASGKSQHSFLDDGEIRYAVQNEIHCCVIFDDHRYVVFGNLIEVPDQLRKIINMIHKREMAERGYTIVHGAGLELDGVGFALGGRAGAGKTTSMLKILAAGGTYISDDKLIARREPTGNWFEMLGVIKWPRACAGTMQGDSLLRQRLPTEAATRYDQMSFDELFGLEEKWEVDIESAYGKSQVKNASRFRRMYCLAWDRQQTGFAIERVDTEDGAFWDEFGPALARDAAVFDRHQNSSEWNAERKVDCRRSLEGIEVFTITGKLDFERIAGALRDHLQQTI